MIIEDDTIIEFVYKGFDSSKPDYIKNKFLRWVPLRTRHDKTQSYRKSLKEKETKFRVINSYLFNKI